MTDPGPGLIWKTEKDMTRYREVNLDRKWMKKYKIGSDAFIQLSFQFAAATHFGHHVNQYEARIPELVHFRGRR